MQTENVHRSLYADLIAKATGAPAELLPILENIMRDEVFHSTLDWQSAAEFRVGARKAHRIYQANAAFYDADRRLRRASFRLMAATRELEEVRDQGAEPAVIAKAELDLALAEGEEAEARAAWEKSLHT
jgi:hypothetical protein